MRQGINQKLQACVEAGRAAAKKLSAPSLPYSYIAEELEEITETLSAASLEEVTACLLEDMMLRLNTVAFAAETEKSAVPARTLEKIYNDLALQEGTLLFYLKGERR